MGPLHGITVLSLAEQYPGPYATLLLADLGADVILVERPAGDPTRQFPPFYESLNRNKRSITLNLKSDAGRRAFLDLCRGADVVLEGYRPGVAERLGIAVEDIRAVKPDIVYVSISGFGQSGPLRDRPAHDISYQALAGMLHDRKGKQDPGEPPSVCYADLASGMFAVIMCLSGLQARTQDDTPTYFDVSITDCLISWMTTSLFAAANGYPEPGIPPRREPGFGFYATSDGELIALSIAHEDWFWEPLCAALGLEHHAALDFEQRGARYEALRADVARAIGAMTLAQLEPLLDAAGVPFAPVLSLEEVIAHPHTAARELLTELPAADGHPARRHVRLPARMPGHEHPLRRHVPRLGEHTVEVLREAGLAEADIEAATRGGAAAASA